MVVMPFVYFYLGDYVPGGALADAEGGMAVRESRSGSLTGSNVRTDVKEL